MISGRGLFSFGSIWPALLFAACQPGQRLDDNHATPTTQQVALAYPTTPLTPADSAATLAIHSEKQTLFPDSLRPVELSVEYWTGPQLDSLRAMLEADSIGGLGWVQSWTNRYRVMRSGDYTELRLFFRPLGTPVRWAELNLSKWLGELTELPYLTARAVELNQRPPEELLVNMEGGNYASGIREKEEHTLLISFDGPPRVIWHSLDGRTEEIPPYLVNNGDGETEGGNYASAQREIIVRRGLVHVGRMREEGTFESGAKPKLTPIAPGTYAYRAGRFQRVGR
jgi:hypothetical protein